MSAIQVYQRKKQEVAEAEAFIALLQSGVVFSTDCNFTVKRDGQTTAMPDALRNALVGIASNRVDNLLDAALKKLRQDVTDSGQAAKAEYLAILQADGIVP